jgi:hypothetical protein
MMGMVLVLVMVLSMRLPYFSTQQSHGYKGG